MIFFQLIHEAKMIIGYGMGYRSEDTKHKEIIHNPINIFDI